MMFTKMRLFAIAGMVMSSSTLNGWAAESLVYHFQGGSVTVTPGVSRPASAKEDVSESPAPVPIDVANDRQRIIIRPVSLKLAQQTPPPAPQQDGEVPQLNLNSEPARFVVPSVQSQSVPGSQQIVVPCDGCDLPVITPRVTETLPKPSTNLTQAAMYRDVYNAIPYSRVEYAANPSYRHDATLEFLFGQMRQTVINRGTTNVNHYYNNDGYGYGNGVPWFYPYYPYGLRITR